MRGVMVAALALLVGCGGDDGGGSRVDDIMALTGDAAAGESVFASNCAVCHGADGTGGTGPDITGESEADEVAGYVLDGADGMTAFDGVLSDQEIADVVAYVTESL
ncbi:MAG: cytochrome c [Alphaproteobacteria bacterium]|nr:cytochrome c [Alphaproteobacteria bacterium]